jgi:phage terminase small subunit
MALLTMTEEQKALFDDLTTLQQEVSLASLSGKNDIDSYKASSGKAATVKAMESSVSQILGNHKVVRFMDAMKAVAVNDAIMSRDEALVILSNNARVKVSDIATFSYVQLGEDEDGNPIMGSVWKMKDSEDIDKDVLSCIKSVTMTKQGPKIELHDQQAAIKQLSTMQGWDSANKVDLTSSDGTMTPKGFNDFYKSEDNG